MNTDKHLGVIVRQPNGLFGRNPEIFYKVYFLIDFDSPESTLSESAGCTKCTLERFEKFKMASKMAAIIAWMTLFAISIKFR